MEIQMVGVAHLAEHLDERTLVRQLRDALARAQPPVVVALGADGAVRLPGFLGDVALAARADLPQRLRRRNLRLLGLFLEPAHFSCSFGLEN